MKYGKSSKDQLVQYKENGIQGVFLAFCFKSDEINPSFILPITCYLEDAETEKTNGHILFLTQICDPNGGNATLQTPDVFIMSIERPN